MTRPGPAIGALVGFLLTTALAALSFLAMATLGAAFPPFALFDALARVLPGSVVTFGIDTLVDLVLLANLGPVADAAKAAEQTLAVLVFLILGAAAGAAAFAYVRRDPGGPVRPLALGGAALGVGALLLALAVGGPQVRLLPSAAWLIASFAAWGAMLGWCNERLARPPARRGAPTEDEGGGADPHRVQVPSVERLDRRRFLIRLGGATAAVTVAGAGVGAWLRQTDEEPAPAAEATAQPWSQQNPLPNADAEVRPAPGTRPELTPVDQHYRIDINTIAPRVDGDDWRLRVGGLVDAPLELSLDELRAYPPVHQFVTLSCISNRLGGDLIDTTRWTGVSLQRLLPDLGIRDEATHLRISSVDGFFEVLALDTARIDPRVMLAYAWDGLPLSQDHGYPLRVYVPDLYGMKQPKWIDRIEAIDGWEEGFWVERGWDAEARVRSTSVIDTVATDALTSDGSGSPRVPIGGIAHAGARGISRVEVSVDEGPWQEARLRRPLSGLTWVVWRFDWAFQEGRHTFTVRCVDGNGEPQIEARNPVRPSGATGLLREEVTL